ncbi:MAG: hypothetical protein KAU28_06610 [Phycisphaerae bacterium]|nr:hypothetical protein [Phycisphaerae bacterium]
MPEEPKESMEEVIRKDGRYPPAAYAFLNEGLGMAVKETYGNEPAPSGQRHVTGRQMCMALRKRAIEKWGMLARTVLKRWNIRATIDFGNMVYLLINQGFMRKTEEDSIEDFRDVYSFSETFDVGGEFELKE